MGYDNITEEHLLLVEDLYMTLDGITSVKNGDFGGLTNLEDLWLDSNPIETLPENIFKGLSKLEELRLNGNNMETLPSDIFDGLSKLEELDLRYNEFSSLPDNIFKGLTSLEKLRLETLDPAIEIPIEIVRNPNYSRAYAKINTCAPFEMLISFKVTNASVESGVNAFRIRQGSQKSLEVNIYQQDENVATTVDIDGELPSIPNGHDGYKLVKPDDLPITVTAASAAPSLTEAAQIPDTTEFLPNYPNPFNPETWIPYQLANPSTVRITIYNTQGIVVRHLDLGHQPAGYYTSRSRAAHWDGKNATGERIASGIYFYRFEADSVSLLRKMVILK